MSKAGVAAPADMTFSPAIRDDLNGSGASAQPGTYRDAFSIKYPTERLWLGHSLTSATGERIRGFTMKIEFGNPRLSLIGTDRAAETGLSRSVIRSWHETVIVIDAIPDAHTLRNWQSLGYERLEFPGQHSIRLIDQWRLIFELDENYSPPVMIVLEIDENQEVCGRVDHDAN
jgi:plasmid maintenance system killer protein